MAKGTNWYAVRLAPGSLKVFRYLMRNRDEDGKPTPQRGFHTDPDEVRTNLEVECERAGVVVYVPYEPREVQHRRTKMHVRRDLPLVPGHAFIQAPLDYMRLSAVPSITAILGNDGKPFPIPATSIEKLRKAEAAMLVDLHHKRSRRIAKGQRKSRRDLVALYPKGRAVIARILGGEQEVTIEGTGADGMVRVIAEMFGGKRAISIDPTDIDEAA